MIGPQIRGALLALILVGCASQPLVSGDSDKPAELPELVPLHQVRITDGPFYHAQQTNLSYLLALDADRLLAPYLREAGLNSKSQSYGNWENTGLDGHIGGHYVSALSLAWAATGNSDIGARLDYMLAELYRAQQASGGYLGGIPSSKEFWQQIKAGDIRADLFSLNERWVPLYNIDKIFHGLRDAYQIGQRPVAKTMLLSLGEWMLDVTDKLSAEQIQTMLYSEHGALNAVFADMASISGDKRYLDLAEKFTHQLIVQPLVEYRDELTGLHANTQIPKIVGALKAANLNDNTAWADAANYFWQTVSQQRSVAIGGNSVREHFHASDDFSPMIDDVEGPETCNTYNMLKLSKLLFLRTGDTRYLDFYERATYNHILSSQHPQHGGLVYFTPMRPGHYRMYSSVEDSMWCCVGSGIENHSKYGELIYAQSDEALWVNEFIPSVLDWQQTGWTVTQITDFPDDTQVELKLSAATNEPRDFELKIRDPEWAEASLRFEVNGQAVDATLSNGYWVLSAPWQNGDVITFSLPAQLHVEQLPDGQDYYALLYGPVVLSAKIDPLENESLNFVADDSRMGHIAAGPVCPPEALPVMLGEPQQFIAGMTRDKGHSLAFSALPDLAASIAKPDTPTQLIPFFRLHDSRYQIYWPQMSKLAFTDYVSQAKKEAEQNALLASWTVDKVTPGQQQPEVEHQFKGQHTRAGVNNGHHWRDASGWFEYQLGNPKQTAKILRITYFVGDVGREFVMTINGEQLAEVSLPVQTSPSYQQGKEWYNVDYVLPESMQQQSQLNLRFTAAPDSLAGGIYGIRLMSQTEAQ